MKANKNYGGLGGHIASYASFAEVFETGFNHFFKGGDEADCCCQQSWDHQNAEPTDIEAVIGRSYPLTEIFPSGCLLT